MFFDGEAGPYPVFVTVRMDDTLRPVLDQVPSFLTVCVVDTGPSAVRRRLHGPTGCETQAATLLHVRDQR